VDLMIALTEEMKAALGTSLADGNPVMVASALASGVPDIVFKGSVMVWDTEHLAYWERAHGQTERALKENPNVCLLYRNPAARKAWKFFGVAELHPGGELRDAVMARTVQAELDRDPERKGTAVIIRVDKVIEMGQVIMQREA